MKSVLSYINEAMDKDEMKAKKLEEKMAKHKEKIEKLTNLINKKKDAIQKLLEKYKKDSDVCKLIPFEIFNNFKYLTYAEQGQLAKELGVKSLNFPFNPAAGDMYYKKSAEVRLKHGITPDTPYKGNEDKFKAADDDPDSDTLHRFYYDYLCKMDDLVESVGTKERELKELEEKIISVSDAIKSTKAKAERLTDLFKQVPELADFIEKVGEQQYKFLIERNEKLKTLWDKYEEEIAKLDKQYGSEWTARCNRAKDNGEGYNKYKETNKIKPKQVVRTEAQLKKEVEEWKLGERQLLASRVLTEFGVVKSTSLHIGADGNVNGTIVGSLKTATIETIFAGGYNIQCLHTRLLVHER